MATVVRAFQYTGAIQTWVVPTGVTVAHFELWGASGGSWYSAAHTYPQKNDEYALAQWYGSSPSKWNNLVTYDIGFGGGGYVAGDLTVTPGDTYSLYVGGNGENGYNGAGQYTAKGGWNGGGTGGKGHNLSTFSPIGGGGGGGATDIRYGGTALSNRIAVAGGAGGGGGAMGLGSSLPTPQWAARPTSPVPPFGSATFAQAASVGYEHFQQYSAGANCYGFGGYGGGGLGASGWWNGANTSSRGGGATVSAGGAAGAAHSGGGTAGTAGTSGQGGNGGAGSSTAATTLSAPVQGGGGGGGGYFGGGGGGTGGQSGGWYPGGGGGGGSNFLSTSPVWSNSLNIVAVRPPSPTALARDGATKSSSVPQKGGLVRVTWDQPPTADIVAPVQGAVVASNRANTVTVEWTTAALTALGAVIASCGGADMRWSVAGANTWTQVHVDAPADSSEATVVDMIATIPNGALTGGTSYDIQARVYDTAGDVSDWDAITVKALPVPTAPTITAPSAGANAATPFSITWTNPNSLPGGNEVLYRVLLRGTGHTVDSGVLNSGVRMNFANTPDCKSASGYIATAPDTLAQDATVTDPWGATGVNKVTWNSGGSSLILLGGATLPKGTIVTLSLYVKSATTGAPPLSFLIKDGLFGSIVAQSDPVAASTSYQRISLTYAASGTDVIWLWGTTPTTGTITYFSDYLVEISATLNPFFGKTTKDTALSATLNTSSAGWAYLTGTGATQTLSYTVDSTKWPFGADAVTMEISLATVDSQGFFSDAATRAFVVNTNPPGTPTGSATADATAGTITLNIHVVDTPNSTQYVDIFRTAPGETEIRVATQIPPDVSRNVVYVDYTPATDVAYTYRVRAYSSSGGFADLT